MDMRVMCPASSSDAGQTCKNSGNSAPADYANRIRMDLGANYCGIKIDSAHPWDTGRWECTVGDSSNAGIQMA